ncbi:DMT family transporter [Calothrix sp. NIES-3974]|uniref:DMT family transporter n=1 Tax=Calothrix sp. NIES-3974 TaxID=2005462 RepID=UPI000B5F3B58|nr:DMT family transporter [Calothrix sp. NIES-3974]BAZ07677.1 hypothetical protein NIES3974_43420 [Calothrix sp. NIES-3974]
MSNFVGEIAALSAAGLWAVASVLYGRVGEVIPPLLLNLFKGIIAIAFLILTIFLVGDSLPSLPLLSLTLILLSGVIGIGVGDTIFFAAINSLGARRTLLLGTLAPPLTAIFGLLFLDEQLQIQAWWGIFLTIIGVAWVITERTTDQLLRGYSQLLRGTAWGLLAAITNSIGAILSRAAFKMTTASPLWVALLRLSAGEVTLILLITVFSRGKSFADFRKFTNLKIVIATIVAAFCGTYLGIWLQQTAIKLTPTGIAQTLLQTSPIFILPLAVFTGEKISGRAIAGVLVAIAGIALLFYLNQPPNVIPYT